MPEDILSAIRSELQSQADEKTRGGAQRYFKEEAAFYGVKTNLVEKIAREHFPEVKSLAKKAIFALCEDLLRSDFQEEAFIACDWSYRLRPDYDERDFATFERWLTDYVNNWAKCDTLCNHTIGSFVDIYPQYVQNLKLWAHSSNRWLKRGSAVTLIIPAKQGKFLPDIFEIADILLKDNDDLVQKGYGWMLKDASIMHCPEVFDYVMRNKKSMPRTALRYAIERMPPDLKSRAMQRD